MAGSIRVSELPLLDRKGSEGRRAQTCMKRFLISEDIPFELCGFQLLVILWMTDCSRKHFLQKSYFKTLWKPTSTELNKKHAIRLRARVQYCPCFIRCSTSSSCVDADVCWQSEVPVNRGLFFPLFTSADETTALIAPRIADDRPRERLASVRSPWELDLGLLSGWIRSPARDALQS